MAITRRESMLLLGAGLCAASERTLEDRWRTIAAGTDGTVGAAALHLASGRAASMNADVHFPLASVCKLPIAAHIFAMVDERQLALDQLMDVPRYDLYPGVSGIADRWPNQKRFPLSEMVELMVAKSDNTAVQTLFRIGGGAPGILSRLTAWKIAGMRIDRDERTTMLEAAGVRKIPPVQEWTPNMSGALLARVSESERLAAMLRFIDDPRDSGTPASAVQLLRKLYAGQLLSRELTGRLVRILESTTTGPGRIKGLLPRGTVVAHKTGTAGNAGKLNGATNDAGVITLPDGGQLALAVFIKGSTRDQAAREAIIARIALAAFQALS